MRCALTRPVSDHASHLARTGRRPSKDISGQLRTTFSVGGQRGRQPGGPAEPVPVALPAFAFNQLRQLVRELVPQPLELVCVMTDLFQITAGDPLAAGLVNRAEKAE